MPRRAHLGANFVESGARYVVVDFFGCAGFNPWLWEVLFGASTALLELGGAKNIQLRALSGRGDAPEMRMEARWE